MTTSASRGLIKSMLIIGSAQVVNIFISIIRMKVLAVLLGPSGVGLLSIYNNLLELVQQTAGLGMETSGVREIASSRGNETTLSRMRRVLFAAHLLQGTLAMLAVWLLRERIAIWLFSDALRMTEVGLIGIAILFGLLASAQTALLQGLRNIGDLGRVTVIGAFIGTLVGLAAVWLQGERGLIWFILVQPLAIVLIALHYTRRLPKPMAARLSLNETWEVWKPMAKLGTAFMFGGLATAATLLLVRSLISKELGLDAAGYFAAAWGITMTYVGFLLSAMGADYYPRLTEVINDKVEAVRLMNEQAQLGLAIGGPVLLLLVGLAPWVISLLFSKEFAPAATLIQWHILGNVFKIADWSLGFAHVAAGRSKVFLLNQLAWSFIFLPITWLGLPSFGIAITGPAFVVAYGLGLIINIVLVRHFLDFRWQGLSIGLLGLHSGLSLTLLVIAFMAPVLAAALSIPLALTTGLFALRIVLSKLGKHSRLPTRLYGIFERLGWPIQSAV